MYDLELNIAKELIIKENAKNVLIQLPDGLKPKSKDISDYLSKETNASIIIWAGTCFGACDYPYYVKDAGVDLLIAWGHSEWKN
ncbi:hypothetical protein BVX95_00955 [archaeon D22]|nr:hypothetical protein BVX95_00955 [archaeon D22]